MRKCVTCRYYVSGEPGHCRAPGTLTALSPMESAFPVIGEASWCYGHRLSVWRLIKWLLRSKRVPHPRG